MKKRLGKNMSSRHTSWEWEHWGEGSLETLPKEDASSSVEQFKAHRQLAQSVSSPAWQRWEDRQEPVLILWSSSDSELSDTEPKPSSANSVTRGWRPHHHNIHKSYSSCLHMIPAVMQPDKGEFQAIEWWESDPSDDDNSVEISDCDSVSEEQQHSTGPTMGMDAKISDCSFDAEPIVAVTPTRGCVNSEQHDESGGRSASDWVKSIQALLRTPPKLVGREITTPEDSARKKRKFLRGGLAERLSKLQCRQRSAISFWRHQSSHSRSSTGTKPSVLVLEVLSIQEDCGLQLALCRPLEPLLTNGGQHSASDELLVLFSKDTTAYLLAGPGDTVYVYPPWQKLTVKDQSHVVILNTHFSQKLVQEDEIVMESPRAALALCCPYPLTRVLRLTDTSGPVPQAVLSVSEVPALWCQPAPRESTACREVSDSLLEVMEACGWANWSGRQVEVVVQRVYCLYFTESSSQPLLKNRGPQSTTQAEVLSQPSNRVCLLVQDSYGVFSEVQLHIILSADGNLLHYTAKWEGQLCVLQAVKPVQRLTWPRSAWLFSLIDSLWPPSIPPRTHGATLGSWEDPAKLQAPRFCYLLLADRGEEAVQVVSGQSSHKLYRPAVPHSLKEVLQGVSHSHRCTFTAAVIHKRLKSTDGGRSEFWLFVTDPSLQTAEGEQQRTVRVYVSSSCVVLQDVAGALSDPSICQLTFKDAVKEHDAVVCVERSVIQLEPLQNLDRTPTQLDQLGPTTAVNTLCTLRGVIVGVDESTAYSWPTCHLCGSDKLEEAPGNQQKFLCGLCGATVGKPIVKMHLEVFLHCPSLSQYTVKIKLLQDTIMSVLSSAACGHEGYEVENVLGAALGPLSAYVRVVMRQPALWMGLEEISL
ncbi:DNA repair-scaffolding protein isoform X2 [Scleropages formosus]|nr:DNA repair-scaffolding protein isoform X2 [Scleropages formosus]